ncbi:MAG: M56 family metallopeptidase [Pirellulaceae bacterium]|nr:M56 family metallopeptidase [Pirellulaceae bacterium]
MVELIFRWVAASASLALTYLLLSTILLSASWLAVRCWSGLRSSPAQEAVWKAATVASVGLAAFCAALSCWGQSGWTWVIVNPISTAAANQPASIRPAAVGGDRRPQRTTTTVAPRVSSPSLSVESQPTGRPLSDPAAQLFHSGDRIARPPPVDALAESVQRSAHDDDSHARTTRAGVMPLARERVRITPQRSTDENNTARKNTEREARAGPSAATPPRAVQPPILGWCLFAVGVAAPLFFLLGGLRLLCSEYLLRRRLAKLVPVTGRASELMAQLPAGRVRLLSSDAVGPFAFGLRRPYIVIPRNCETELSDDELHSLLAHELAHHQRGDLWWLLWGRFLTNCLAWQPLHWLAVKQWRASEELACDDWALLAGASPIALARLLTQFVEWRLTTTVGAVSAMGTSAELVERVRRLLDDDRELRAQRSRWTLLVGLICLAVFLACFAPTVSLSLDLPAWTKRSAALPASNSPPSTAFGGRGGDALPDTRSAVSRFGGASSAADETFGGLTAMKLRSEFQTLDLQLNELLPLARDDPRARDLIVRLEARRARMRELWSRVSKSTEPLPTEPLPTKPLPTEPLPNSEWRNRE